MRPEELTALLAAIVYAGAQHTPDDQMDIGSAVSIAEEIRASAAARVDGRRDDPTYRTLQGS